MYSNNAGSETKQGFLLIYGVLIGMRLLTKQEHLTEQGCLLTKTKFGGAYQREREVIWNEGATVNQIVVVGVLQYLKTAMFIS